MNRLRASLVWFAAIGSLCAGLALWRAAEARHPTDFIAFTADGYSCPIYVADNLGDAGTGAAKLLQLTLAQAAARSSASFPIQRGDREHMKGRGVFLSVHRGGWKTETTAVEKLNSSAAYSSQAGRLSINTRTSDTLETAVSWFLETELGAHWFFPGPLGVQVPTRNSFSLPAKMAQWSPSFISRHLAVGGSPEEQAWFSRNRLNALFEHRHSMGVIFKRDDLLKTPELAPLISGRRYQPRVGDTNSWQPNIASPLAAPFAANVLKQWLRESPTRLSVPLSMNDTVGYDQSPATVKLAGGRGYFRGNPDYSNLVFGFVNQVAREVARDFPNRFVTTYAYDWTENTPDFRVEPNVVPFLTADRSQWFDRQFAAEDQALIRRWVAAGPRVVGLYDYLYGAPFLVPRPTLYAVAQSIPFAYETGVGAYFAECSPNWGLDGPKLWLAAQLLWDARQDSAKLLDTYYREFWQETAAPMREFFALCDAQWRKQPLPSYWLKYFKDEQQHLLYPPDVRRSLRVQLDDAARLAKSKVVRERLRMVSESFAVTETFAEYCEQRETLIRLLQQAQATGFRLLPATKQFLEAKHRFLDRHAEVQKEFPLALHGPIPRELTRNDPLGSALWQIGRWPRDEATRIELTRLAHDYPEVKTLLAVTRDNLHWIPVNADPALQELRIATSFDATTLDWATAGPWRGNDLPHEHRAVTLVPDDIGQSVRLSGCLEEIFSQWVPAEPGALYFASARVKAKVSPGNLTFLVIYFTDAADKIADLGTIQRLPVGEWSDATELTVVVRAPKNARRIGIAVRAVNQVGDDFAEFSRIGLDRLE